MLLDACGNVDLLYIVSFIRRIVYFLKIAAPVVVIIMSAVDVLRAVIANNKEAISKNIARIPNRLFLCAIILLLPTFFEFILDNVDANNTSLACLTEATPSKVEEAYKKAALGYVEKAEASFSSADYSDASLNVRNAYDALSRVKDNDYKQSMKARLKILESKINNSRKSFVGGGGGHSFEPGPIIVDTNASLGDQIAQFANNYLGLTYLWGWNDLSKAVDCSGFTMEVYKHFGINLTHSANAQANDAKGREITSINNAKPGDLVFFNNDSDQKIDHVGIYMGSVNGKHYRIHASGGASCPDPKKKCKVVYDSFTKYAMIKRFTN